MTAELIRTAHTGATCRAECTQRRAIRCKTVQPTVLYMRKRAFMTRRVVLSRTCGKHAAWVHGVLHRACSSLHVRSMHYGQHMHSTWIVVDEIHAAGQKRARSARAHHTHSDK
eukprot:CAMPEP_0181226826 /NCGR_PEP_ID=MMETSP1096-20121128/32460_1 /TAXON_ID=156174 ORGANISM="Chrysochromulina ericina, Strain CCMP281" /NCGR_SAMPLE_ID=MMETSP1096 /ASSEMBLY_ACC=CAM_ASM_000453 /LENGTH=112 /DNA_ID=CAMNT_0023320187 /DNA_START=295 /DNA_END=633 /DNA_ORIENTATION=+